MLCTQFYVFFSTFDRIQVLMRNALNYKILWHFAQPMYEGKMRENKTKKKKSKSTNLCYFFRSFSLILVTPSLALLNIILSAVKFISRANWIFPRVTALHITVNGVA